MVDVDAIRAMLESDPAVRAQEERIASEARNAASLQVDKQMAEASDAIRSELSRRGSAASDELAKTQEAALAELEAKSQAVLRAEAKMREIAAEREALEAEAKTTGGENMSKKKWGASVGDDVDENAERVESAKAAACSAIFGTALSAPLLLSQSPGGFVTAESLGGVFVSTALFGVVYRYAVRDDFGNDQLKFGVLGAFGLTRGLGEADVYLHGSDALSFSSWAEAALLAGESVLTFAFAYAALEYGFKNDYLKPFPMSRNAPRDDD
jgi:type IV secretory pathway VirJ component